MAHKYATAAETVSDYMPEVVLNGENTPIIERHIEAASRYVDDFCGRLPGYYVARGATPGDLQKVTVSAEGDVTGPGDVILRITSELLETPIEERVSAAFAELPADYAATLRAAALANEDITDLFSIAGSGVEISAEVKEHAPNDPTLKLEIFPPFLGGAEGIVSKNSTVTTPGTYDGPTPRRFRGAGENYLQMPPYVPGTASIDGIAPSVYYENDVNGWLFWNDQNFNGGDYFAGSRRGFFEAGRVYIVSARWGFAETPPPIVAATKEIAAAIWSKGAGIIGDVSPSGFVIERDIPITTKALLKPYIRREFEVR